MAENLYRKATKEEQEAAWAECRMMYQHDQASMREDGRREGLSQGEAIGLKKGAAQKQREIAKNLKLSGIPIDVIAKNTGLTEKEIEAL